MSTRTLMRRHARAMVRTAVLLAAAVMLSVMFAEPVLARGPGSGGNGSGGSGWMGGRPGGYGIGPDRDVSVDGGDNQARVRSMGDDGGDQLDFQLDATNRFTIEMRYVGDSVGEPGMLVARLVYRDLVEFNDTDGDGLLDEGDTIVSNYSLEQVECDRLEYMNSTLGDSVGLHTITARTRDGVFALVSRIPDAPVMAPQALSSSWMKLDIMVDGFQYARQDTLLALRTRLETSARLTIIENSTGLDSYVAADEGFIGFEAGELLGFYSWARNATVDGSDMRIGTTTTTTVDGVEVSQVYGRGASIVHDPKLGMPIASEVAGDVLDLATVLLPYAIAAAASAMVVVAVFYARRRGDDSALD